jgi:hypothetical protein
VVVKNNSETKIWRTTDRGHPQPKIQTIMGNDGGYRSMNADDHRPEGAGIGTGFKEFSPGAAFIQIASTWAYDALVSDVQELINGTMTPSEMLDAIDTFYNENKPQ